MAGTNVRADTLERVATGSVLGLLQHFANVAANTRIGCLAVRVVLDVVSRLHWRLHGDHQLETVIDIDKRNLVEIVERITVHGHFVFLRCLTS